VLHHLCNGLSFAVGTLLHLAQHWTGVSLAGTLPATAWPRPLDNDVQGTEPTLPGRRSRSERTEPA
jgi:hypothetical protein